MTFRKEEDTGNWKRSTRSVCAEFAWKRLQTRYMTDYGKMMMKKL